MQVVSQIKESMIKRLDDQVDRKLEYKGPGRDNEGTVDSSRYYSIYISSITTA